MASRNITSACPRNRIGAFATELPNMLLPAKHMDTISLFNYYSTAMEYRQHSALKIRVKPRQALASVNTKLQEVKLNRNERTPPPPAYIIADEKRIDCDFSGLSTDEDKKKRSHEDVANIMLNKDGFRPSTVRRTPKKPDSGLGRNDSQRVEAAKSAGLVKNQVFMKRAKTDLSESVSDLMKKNQIDDQEVGSSKNLTDDEFLSLVKEYRESKYRKTRGNSHTIPIESSVEESNSSPPLNSPRTAATASTTVINLESQLLESPSSSSINKSGRLPAIKKLNYPAYYVNYLNTKSQQRSSTAGGKVRPQTVKVLNIPTFAN